MDRVNPWSLEHLLFYWPAWFPASSLCSTGVRLLKMEGGGSHGGNVSILRSRIWLPLQTHGMPEMLGYCWGIAGREMRGTVVGGQELHHGSRRAWPRTCQVAGAIFLYPDDCRDKMCWRPGSGGTEKVYSGSSINLKLFLLLNPHYCASLAAKERIWICFFARIAMVKWLIWGCGGFVAQGWPKPGSQMAC